MAILGVTVRTISESDINGQSSLSELLNERGRAVLIRLKTDHQLEVYTLSADDQKIADLTKELVFSKALSE